MPCDTRVQVGQDMVERQKQVTASLDRLKRYLAAGQVAVVIGPNGALALKGWKDRDDLTDACAIRALATSWEMRKAIAKAEAMGGTRANIQATIAGGMHSHDGGRTWGKH